jgi:metal-dependent amidase/aminoacylase/carboxypeptidase family protein
MGGEDFAYFAQRVPGLMMRLGIYNESAGSVYSAHSPQFRLDEDAIPTGIATFLAFVRGVGGGVVPLA